MTHRPLRFAAITPALILFTTALTFLTACEKDTPKPTGALEKITIAMPSTIYSTLAFVASSKGFFKAEGLDVIRQSHEFGKVALQSVIEGKADLAVSSDTAAMFAILGGQKINILAVMATSKKNEAIVARRDRGVNVPHDLEGKRIGVPLGTTAHFFLDSYLSANGIDKAKVTALDMKPDQLTSALMGGEVDAVSIWQPLLKQLELSLGDRGEVFYDERIYSSIMCISARRDTIEAHPEIIRKVLRGLLRAEATVRENPDESRRLVAEALKIDKTVLDAMWSSVFFRVSLDQSLLVSLEDQALWAQEYGLTANKEHPNFLDFIHREGLQSVKPDAVRIIP